MSSLLNAFVVQLEQSKLEVKQQVLVAMDQLIDQIYVRVSDNCRQWLSTNVPNYEHSSNQNDQLENGSGTAAQAASPQSESPNCVYLNTEEILDYLLTKHQTEVKDDKVCDCDKCLEGCRVLKRLHHKQLTLQNTMNAIGDDEEQVDSPLETDQLIGTDDQLVDGFDKENNEQIIEIDDSLDDDETLIDDDDESVLISSEDEEYEQIGEDGENGKIEEMNDLDETDQVDATETEVNTETNETIQQSGEQIFQNQSQSQSFQPAISGPGYHELYFQTPSLFYRCDMCGMRFKYEQVWRSHVMNYHEQHQNGQPFRCVPCGREFVQKSNLEAHLRTHATENGRRLIYKCRFCKLTFAFGGNRDKHEQGMHRYNFKSMQM